MSENNLSLEQKRTLYRDGFVIIRDAIPIAMVQEAKQLIESEMQLFKRRILAPAELATHSDITALFKETRLARILRNVMGPFPDVISCQIAVTPAGDRLGGTPFPHVDGGWSGPIPNRAEDIEFPRGRPKDAVTFFGANDEKRGTNDGLLWQDPDKTISLGSYSALVGVALNDQSEPGNGQFGVLKGMHELVEESFQMQRRSGGVIGPEGSGWPRIRIDPNGIPRMNGLPEMVRQEVYSQNAAKAATEDWPWPELTPVLLRQGDAVITLHSCPHTATPNLGPNPRMSLYFRIRRYREGNPHEGQRRVGHGVSDHPDRGYFGQFLDYPPDYNPWQTSIDKLCDHWSEWQGMQEINS